ncbi:MAG: CapA family protein [Clostridia bacterium]|nr:CapA family protein [Clostridia bacterium]
MRKRGLAVLVLILSLLIQHPVHGAVFLQRVCLKAVGDIMVHDIQYQQAFDPKTGTYDFYPMFAKVKKNLEADILVGNLETTLSGQELGFSGYPRFNSPDNLAETLAKLNFDLLFTANNHCLDKGEYGLRRTIEVLDKNNILHTGTFRSRDEAQKPCIITAKGISFGFLNYTYGTNGLKVPEGKEYLVNYIDVEKMVRDIGTLRPLVDMVVVGLHFGNEYWQNPSEEQRFLVKEAVNAGADIILGSHPHVLQPFEFIDVEGKKAFVVYSLGNFVSAQKQRYTDSVAILEIIIEKSILDKHPKIVQVDFTPIWVRRFYELGRLKMEVIPVENYNEAGIPLTAFDEEKIVQVNSDVNKMWVPVKEKNKNNLVFSLWANNFLPVANPLRWLPALVGR